MKNCKKHLIVALIVLFVGQFIAPKAAHSQIMEVGASVGLSYYMGDINPKKPFLQSDLGWGVLVRYYEGTRWAFRLAYSNLQLHASDKASGYRPERGLSFHTNVHDIALIAEFNFFDYFTGSKRNGLSPYIFGGISMLFFDPKADDGTALCDLFTDTNGDDVITDKTGREAKYSKAAASIPFGIGVKYSLGRRIGVAAEWRWDWTLTDWLDDCHGYYTDPNNPIVQYADPTGFVGPGQQIGDQVTNTKSYIQRGNSSNKDWYGYLNVSITYKFNLPNGDDCNKKERYKNYD